jgi:hypothetical protein
MFASLLLVLAPMQTAAWVHLPVVKGLSGVLGQTIDVLLLGSQSSLGQESDFVRLLHHDCIQAIS